MDGEIQLISDGKGLAVVRGPDGEGPAPADVLVPAPDWKAGFRLSRQGRPVALACDGGRLRFSSGGRSVTAAPAEGRFPRFEDVLPKAPAPLAVRVNPGLLAGVLGAAAALAPEDGVLLLYYGRDKPLGVSARNGAGQFFDALLVPLT